MTPEERDRLVKVEAQMRYIEERAERIEQRMVQYMTAQGVKMDVMSAQLQGLLDAANMGKGAWWAMVKAGGILIAFISLAVMFIDWVKSFVQPT